MIYRSNLAAPDLQPYFKHTVCRVMPHSMGHDVLSDWADKADDDPVFGIYKRCGFWTHDEAAILYNVADRVGGHWVDIGCHTGWTTAHIAAPAGVRSIHAVDPVLSIEFADGTARDRAIENWEACQIETKQVFCGMTADYYFIHWRDGMPDLAGACIDGDHSPPAPLKDAVNAHEHGARIIIFHDFSGRPVQEGVEWLMEQGYKCRVYWTPHMVALCWRGGFDPPTHERDPRINWSGVKAAMSSFPFHKCV